MSDKIKITRVASEKKPPIDYTSLYVEYATKYRNVFITQILEHVFIYRSLGRGEYREIINDRRFEELKKEELICSQCLLYPDPDTVNWDELEAGVPSELMKVILHESYLDNLEDRKNLHNYYRAEMYDLDNQITCIINEAFPTIDIEEIESWDIDKTTKYLSRAEWKLHNLRGLQFVQPEGAFSNQEVYDEEIQRNVQPASEKSKKNDRKETIRGGSREDKLTPDKLRERQEFLKKFPEFANDDIMLHGVDGMAQDGVDSTPPALRPGW